MAMKTDVMQKLSQMGIRESDVEKNLPKGLTNNWNLTVYINMEGNTVVEYQKPGEMFPVAFVSEDPLEAKALMVQYLKEKDIK